MFSNYIKSFEQDVVLQGKELLTNLPSVIRFRGALKLLFTTLCLGYA